MMKWLLLVILTISTAHAARIDCTYEFMGTQYICFATVSHTGVPTLEHVTGGQAPGKHLKDVDSLWIENQNLEALPKGIAGFFKNLKEIHVDTVLLATISASDFEGIAGLEKLYLNNVKLVDLPSDLFSLTPKVKTIEITSDVLAHIGSNLVSGLAHLEVFGITSPCVNKASGAPYPLLSAELSAACPPLDESETTTTTPPATCACEQKMQELQLKIQLLIATEIFRESQHCAAETGF